MSKILVSYRREDGAAYAGRLADRLTQHFGSENVFVDVDAIRPGQDFLESIETFVGSCDALVAVIGKTWLSSLDASGRPRLDNPDDFVRMEIASALRRGIRVIPVLVGGATMPRRAELPDDVSALTRRQALEISDSRFHHDADRLIAALADEARRKPTNEKQRLEPRRYRQWRRTIWGSATLATVVLGLALFIYWPSLADRRNRNYAPPTVVDNPESHRSDAPQPMVAGRTYKVTLQSNGETYFRLSSPLSDLRIVVDVRCPTASCFNLQTEATVLDGDGAVIADHAAKFNLYNEVAARQIAAVSANKPTSIQIKLVNASGAPLDHWVTVLAADSTDLVPFFGASAVRPLRVGDSMSGALEDNGAEGYAVFLERGDYKATLDLSDPKRVTRFAMRGYLALVPTSGGTESIPCRITQYNAVSSRQTGVLSVASDGLYYLRVQVEGTAAQYTANLARR